MLEEIEEQPSALERTIAGERDKYRQLRRLLSGKDIDVIVIVARGSSDNAALFGRYLLEITTGIPVSLVLAPVPAATTFCSSTFSSWLQSANAGPARIRANAAVIAMRVDI